MEDWIDLFTYKKRERRGIAVLFLLIIVMVLAILYISERSKHHELIIDASLEQEYQKRLQGEKLELKKDEYVVTVEGQNRNGLGQVVKNETDISDEDVRFVPKKNAIKPHKSNSFNQENPSRRIVSTKLVIDVNKASAREFAQLKGIGEVLSNRIVNYRNKLGGFVSIDQVGTTYGIEAKVFLQLKSQLVLDKTIPVNKLNFNTASVETLANHPYISEKFAKQIVNFRTKVKPYETFQDVEKLYYLKNNPELLKKLKPYIFL